MNDDPCQPIRAWLPWYVNGTLTAAHRAEVEAHLATCPDCPHEMAQWRKLARGVAAAPLPAVPPASATARVALHRAIAAQTPPRERVSITMEPTSSPAPNRQMPDLLTRRSLFPVAAFALVALIVLSAAWFAHGRGGVASGVLSPATTATHTSAPTTAVRSPLCQTQNVVASTNTTTQNAMVGQSVTVHSITVTLTAFYADATRALVQLHVTTPASVSQIGYAPSDINDIKLAFPSGITLSLNETSTMNLSQSDHRNYETSGRFLPLPLTTLGTAQTATLAIATLHRQTDPDAPLQGPWQFPLTFTAPAAHFAADLNCAVEEFGGYSILPKSIIVAPAARQFDNYPGGVALTVCVAGPEHPASFHSYYNPQNPQGESIPGNSRDPLLYSQALLTVPGAQPVIPQFDYEAPILCRIGSSRGTLHTLTFLRQLPTLVGRLVFNVPSLYLGSAEPSILGPWHFEIDIK